MYLRNIIRALNVLYGMTYDTDIAEIIVSTSTLDMLKNIYKLLNFDDENYCDYNKECNTYQVIFYLICVNIYFFYAYITYILFLCLVRRDVDVPVHLQR